MNEQEAFNKAAKHLLSQMARCTTDDDAKTCLYRGSGGTKCAVGALIPDEEYNERFEARSASSVALRVPALKGLSGSFLNALQAVHDERDPEEWRSALFDLAKRRELTTEAL